MGYHIRIESKRIASLVTIRSRNSELWFINNRRLEESTLGYLAKYAKRYQVKLYAFGIEGNHLHNVAHYPEANRSQFTRDLHSNVAKAVERHTPEYPGGRFWGRRYSGEFLPGPDDIEEYFFYTVLQPVKDGLVQSLREYPYYNCFHDAIYGIKRQFKVVNWTSFNAARRYDSSAHIRDHIEYVEIEYARLPGYENMSKKDYVKLMLAKLHERETKLVQERLREGKGFVGRENLLKAPRGSIPLHSKTSTRYSHRPRVLCVCPIRRHQYLNWYFGMLEAYRGSSERYREGELTVEFPAGTYRPFLKTGPPEGSEGVHFV